MGAYAYCEKCGCGIDEPTYREVLNGTYHCPACEHPADPHVSVNDIVSDLLDEITDLKSRVIELERRR